jgi:hypothetical protein
MLEDKRSVPVSERKYSIPLECFRDLIVDLKRLSTSAPSELIDKASAESEPLLPLDLPVAAE